jgi:hypothetical protein
VTAIPSAIDPTALYAQLIAAGVALNGLATANGQAWTFDAQGNKIDLPPSAAPVIAAYTPPQLPPALLGVDFASQSYTDAQVSAGVASCARSWPTASPTTAEAWQHSKY